MFGSFSSSCGPEELDRELEVKLFLGMLGWEDSRVSAGFIGLAGPGGSDLRNLRHRNGSRLAGTAAPDLINFYSPMIRPVYASTDLDLPLKLIRILLMPRHSKKSSTSKADTTYRQCQFCHCMKWARTLISM